jgi:hypothetical protein
MLTCSAGPAGDVKALHRQNREHENVEDELAEAMGHVNVSDIVCTCRLCDR